MGIRSLAKVASGPVEGSGVSSELGFSAGEAVEGSRGLLTLTGLFRRISNEDSISVIQ